MAPAAFHRISFGGRNTESFHRLGSAFVVASAVPLAAGIVGDIYVAVAKALNSVAIGGACALVVAALLAVLWFASPLVLRFNRARRRQTRRA